MGELNLTAEQDTDSSWLTLRAKGWVNSPEAALVYADQPF